MFSRRAPALVVVALCSLFLQSLTGQELPTVPGQRAFPPMPGSGQERGIQPLPEQPRIDRARPAPVARLPGTGVDEPRSPVYSRGLTLWNMNHDPAYVAQFHAALAAAGVTDLGVFCRQAAPPSLVALRIDPTYFILNTNGWDKGFRGWATCYQKEAYPLTCRFSAPAAGAYRMWIKHSTTNGAIAPLRVRLYREGSANDAPVMDDTVNDRIPGDASGRAVHSTLVDLKAGAYRLTFQAIAPAWLRPDLVDPVPRAVESVTLSQATWLDTPPDATGAVAQQGVTVWNLPMTPAWAAAWTNWQVRPLTWDGRNSDTNLFRQSLAFWHKTVDAEAAKPFPTAPPPDCRKTARAIVFDERWNMFGYPAFLRQRATDLAAAPAVDSRMQGYGGGAGLICAFTNGIGVVPQEWTTSQVAAGPIPPQTLWIASGVTRSFQLFLRATDSKSRELTVESKFSFGSTRRAEMQGSMFRDRKSSPLLPSVSWRVGAFGPSDGTNKVWSLLALLRRPTVTVPANSAAQVWFTMQTDERMAPGRYEATVTLADARTGQAAVELPLVVQVAQVSAAEPRQPLLFGGFTAFDSLPEGDEYRLLCGALGLNVSHNAENLSAQDMQKYGLKFLLRRPPADTDQIGQDLARARTELGLATNQWAYMLGDEQSSVQCDWMKIAQKIRSFSADAGICANPGDRFPPLLFNDLQPYVTLWMPYCRHCSDASKMSVVAGGGHPWMYYTQPTSRYREPAFAALHYVDVHAVVNQHYPNCIGMAFHSVYSSKWHDPWDTAWNNNMTNDTTDVCVMFLPGVNGPILMPAAEAVRLAIQDVRLVHLLRDRLRDMVAAGENRWPWFRTRLTRAMLEDMKARLEKCASALEWQRQIEPLLGNATTDELVQWLSASQ